MSCDDDAAVKGEVGLDMYVKVGAVAAPIVQRPS